jgi:FkbM family methyltransferase
MLLTSILSTINHPFHGDGSWFDDKPDGVWEAEISNQIRALIVSAKQVKQQSNPVVVLDIGANIGWFTLLSLSLGAHTISFEPLKYNTELLSNSIIANGYCDRAKLFKIALGNDNTNKVSDAEEANAAGASNGDVNGNVSASKLMCVKPAYAAVAGNIHNGQLNPLPSTAEGRSQCIELVNVMKLDSFLLFDPVAQHLDIMKIDVEGYESLVIQGGKQFFTKVKPCVVFMEVIPAYIIHSGSKPRDLFQVMFELGFDYQSGYMKGMNVYYDS